MSIMESRMVFLLLCAIIETRIVSGEGGCYTNSSRKLTEGSGTIIFDGTLTNACTWKLPVPSGNNYAFIFVLEKMDLWDEASSTIAGCLTMPAIKICGPSMPYCAVTPSALGNENCNLTKLSEIATSDPSCTNPTTDMALGKEPTMIKLTPEGEDHIASSLSLKYTVIDCTPSATAKPEETTTGTAAMDTGNVAFTVMLSALAMQVSSCKYI